LATVTTALCELEQPQVGHPSDIRVPVWNVLGSVIDLGGEYRSDNETGAPVGELGDLLLAKTTMNADVFR